MKRLDSLCEVFVDGDWIESKDQSPEGIRLVQTGNIGVGEYKDKSDKARYVSQRTFDRLKCTEVVPGDCLVSRLPEPVGRACIVPDTDQRMITGVDCSIIRFKKGEMEPKFFTYYSQSKEYLDDVAKLITGTTRDRISRTNLGSIPIPVPPTEVRQRIVTKLDAAFAALAEAQAHVERNRANARELFESYLNGVFEGKGDGWNEVRILDLGDTRTGSTPPTNDRSNYGDYAPFVKPGDFMPDGTIAFRGDGVSEAGFNMSRPIPANSVLMVCVGATIGKTGFVERMVTSNQQINSVTPSPKYFAKLIYYAMITRRFHEAVLHNASQTTLPIISKSKWESLTITIPEDLKEQERITQELDALLIKTKQLESTYQQKLLELEGLKKGLLGAAFRREL